jgi:hypothetical protein
MNKSILLTSFIFPERLDWFLNYLETKFNVTKDKVYCYNNINDDSKIILTFKLSLPEGKKIDLKNIESGMYILNIKNPDGTVLNRKIIKK